MAALRIKTPPYPTLVSGYTCSRTYLIGEMDVLLCMRPLTHATIRYALSIVVSFVGGWLRLGWVLADGEVEPITRMLQRGPRVGGAPQCSGTDWTCQGRGLCEGHNEVMATHKHRS